MQQIIIKKHRGSFPKVKIIYHTFLFVDEKGNPSSPNYKGEHNVNDDIIS